MKDSFGREIDYARISVTDLCNLRCKYCMPETGVEKKSHHGIMSIEDLCLVADSLKELGFKKIRITGGEPLARRGLSHFLDHLAKLNFDTLALTTNGTLLCENIAMLKAANVKLINVSLDTLNAENYKLITRFGEIAPALEGIQAVLDAGGFELKMNAVLLKGINENEIGDFIKLSEKHKIEMRFIELMPFSSQHEFAAEHFLGADEVIARHPYLQPAQKTDNSTAEYFVTPNGGRIGFIRPLTNKFCDRCNRIRITADGKLITCLHGNQIFDLKPYLASGLTKFIKDCILKKQPSHNLEKGELQKRNMKDIGG